jgi:hypothetical protein
MKFSVRAWGKFGDHYYISDRYCEVGINYRGVFTWIIVLYKYILFKYFNIPR